jgi:glucose/arabinose dehydrogenase
MAETHTSCGVAFVDDVPQRFDNPFGKVLRVNRDCSIPQDNPFVGRAGVLPEIYAIGVRAPEGTAVEPSTGGLWINESKAAWSSRCTSGIPTSRHLA